MVQRWHVYLSMSYLISMCSKTLYFNIFLITEGEEQIYFLTEILYSQFPKFNTPKTT
jgi:hypothetical protein